MPGRTDAPSKAARHLCLVAALIALLAGCVRPVDPEIARLCRQTLPALHPQAERFTITWSGNVARTETAGRPGGTGVHLYYETTPAPVGARQQWILCLLDPARPGSIGPDRLVAVETERGPLAPARLYMLKRYWLATPEGAIADPEPIRGAGQAREVPRGLAITLQTLLAALPQTALGALLAGAYALVYGLVKRTNLAFGDIAVLGGYGAILGITAASGTGAPVVILAAVVLGLWAAATFAAMAGRHVFAPLARQRGQAALIASAALALFLAEALRLAQGSGARAVPVLLNEPVAVARAGDFFVTITPMWLLVTVCAALASGLLLALMQRSRFGRVWRAIADDPSAAALLGHDPRAMQVRAFALAGALAGLAGALTTLSLGSVAHGHGLIVGLKAVIAAILGGAGSIPGAVLAGFGIGLLETAWSALVSIEHREAALFAIITGLLVLRPGGLFGRPELESREPR